MSPYDASFEEGWGVPAEVPSASAHADAVERGDVVPAPRYRTPAPQSGENAEPRAPYLPWYEWRKQGPRGRALYLPAPEAPVIPEEPGTS